MNIAGTAYKPNRQWHQASLNWDYWRQSKRFPKSQPFSKPKKDRHFTWELYNNIVAAMKF